MNRPLLIGEQVRNGEFTDVYERVDVPANIQTLFNHDCVGEALPSDVIMKSVVSDNHYKCRLTGGFLSQTKIYKCFKHV